MTALLFALYLLPCSVGATVIDNAPQAVYLHVLRGRVGQAWSCTDRELGS